MKCVILSLFRPAAVLKPLWAVAAVAVLLSVPGRAQERKDEVVVPFDKIVIDLSEPVKPEVLYGLAENDSDHVILDFEFEVKGGLVKGIVSSCSCAEIISTEIEGRKVRFLVNLSVPFEDGIQSVSFNFFGEGNQLVYSQPVGVFKGKARCVAGKLQASISEFANSAEMKVPVHILAKKSIPDPEVHIEGGDGIIPSKLAMADKGGAIFTVTFKWPEPKIGVLWIVVKSGEDVYRSPFLVTP